jgi:uncharacterized Fe-S center protein
VIFPKKHPDIFTQNLAELFNKAFLSRKENWTLQVLLTFEKLMGKRNFLKTAGVTALAAMAAGKLNAGNSGYPDIGETEDTNEGEKSKVFMTTDISPAGLALVYNALEKPLSGKVAVKVSTGEPGGHYFLSSGLIGNLVQSVNGTIVECNTAYGRQRANTAWHKQVVAEHGFTAIAPIDILDEDGYMSLPFAKRKNITEDFVGSHLANYDACLVLSHINGHAMAGFGGAMKNISIGIASSAGKCWIHSGGKSMTSPWGGEQNAFLEFRVEAAGAVMGRFGDKMLYVNVMNQLSSDRLQ